MWLILLIPFSFFLGLDLPLKKKLKNKEMRRRENRVGGRLHLFKKKKKIIC